MVPIEEGKAGEKVKRRLSVPDLESADGVQTGGLFRQHRFITMLSVLTTLTGHCLSARSTRSIAQRSRDASGLWSADVWKPVLLVSPGV